MDIKTKTERQTKEMVKETVFKERAQKVLASMKENGMDQLIVSDPASINYLMGRLMNPGERLMVLVFDAAAGKTELVISKLYPQEIIRFGRLRMLMTLMTALQFFLRRLQKLA